MTTIIHIGSSKAASTSIQYQFQNLKDDFFYFGKNIDMVKFKKRGVGDVYLDKDCRTLTEVLVSLDKYSGIDPQLKQNIQKKVKLAESQNKIFFYSIEMLCETSAMHLLVNILKEIFPNDLKILYIVRNQLDTIKSLYNNQGHKASRLQIVKNKYVSFKDFFEVAFKNHAVTMGHKCNFWIYDFIRIYNFNQSIEIINKFIPEKDIFVFPFEEIQKNNDLSLILKFIEKKLNRKISSKNIHNKEKAGLGFKTLNSSNKQEVFFKIYAILSFLKINPNKLNAKIKKYFDYKIIFKIFKEKKIEKKYFDQIKKIYLQDNLKLIKKFDSLKDHAAKYKFEE